MPLANKYILQEIHFLKKKNENRNIMLKSIFIIEMKTSKDNILNSEAMLNFGFNVQTDSLE